MIAYDYGLDEWKTWLTDTFRALLLKGSGYTPNKDHHFVADLTPGSNECGQAGYSRQTLATKTRTVSTASDTLAYSCANPGFGSIAAGDSITGMVVYRFVTNDADSILMGYYDLTPTATDGNPFPVLINAGGLAYYNQGA